MLYASNHFYAHSKSQYRSHYKPPSASPSNAPTTLTPSVQVEFQSLQAQQHQCNNIKVFNQNLCPWGPSPKLLSIFKFSNTGNMFIMFSISGCPTPTKNSPTGRTGPWCAVLPAHGHLMTTAFCLPCEGLVVCVFHYKKKRMKFSF